MTNIATGRPHPLRDPGSMYRLGSELSVWSDGGVGSIRRFYEALRLEDLDERWGMTDTETLEKDAPWDWGHDDETNRRIHASRLRVRKAADKEGKEVEEEALQRQTTLRPAMAGGGLAEPARPLPGIIKYDLLTDDLGKPAGVQRYPDDMFPGLKESDRQGDPRLQEFWMRIPVGPGKEGHGCMVLLLTRGLVERLAGVSEWQSPTPPDPRQGLPTRSLRDQPDVIEIVTRALAAERLEPTDEAPDIELWRASQLSLILSSAPGLAGQISGGLFDFKKFSLSNDPKRTFPHMPRDTWLIRCLGGRDA